MSISRTDQQEDAEKPQCAAQCANLAPSTCAPACAAPDVCCAPQSQDSKFELEAEIAGAVTAHFGPLVMAVVLDADLALTAKVNKQSKMYEAQGTPSAFQVLTQYLAGTMRRKYRQMMKLGKFRSKEPSPAELKERLEYGADRIESEMQVIKLMTESANPAADPVDTLFLDADSSATGRGYVHYIRDNVQAFFEGRVEKLWTPCARAAVAQKELGELLMASDPSKFVWGSERVTALVASHGLEDGGGDDGVFKKAYGDYTTCMQNAGDLGLDVWTSSAKMVRQIWFDLVSDLIRLFFVCPLYRSGPDNKHPCQDFAHTFTMEKATRAGTGGTGGTDLDSPKMNHGGSDTSSSQKGWTGIGAVNIRTQFSGMMRKKGSAKQYKESHKTEVEDWTVSGKDTIEHLNDYNVIYDVRANDGTNIRFNGDRTPTVLYAQMPGVTECDLLDKLVLTYIEADTLLQKDTTAKEFALKRREQLKVFCRLVAFENSQSRQGALRGDKAAASKMAHQRAGVNPFARQTKCAQFTFKMNDGAKNSCLPSPLVFLFKRYVEHFTTPTAVRGPRQDNAAERSSDDEKRRRMEASAAVVLDNLATFNPQLLHLPKLLTNATRFKESWEAAATLAGTIFQDHVQHEQETKWFDVEADASGEISFSFTRWFGAVDDADEADDPFDICEDPGADQLIVGLSHTSSSTTAVYDRSPVSQKNGDLLAITKDIGSDQSALTRRVRGRLRRRQVSFGVTLAGGLPFSTDAMQPSLEISYAKQGTAHCLDVALTLAMMKAEDDDLKVFGVETGDGAKFERIVDIVVASVGAIQDLADAVKGIKEGDGTAEKLKKFFKKFIAAAAEGAGKALAMKFAPEMSVGGGESEGIVTTWPSITLSFEGLNCEATPVVAATLDTVTRVQASFGGTLGAVAREAGVSGKIMYENIASTSAVFPGTILGKAGRGIKGVMRMLASKIRGHAAGPGPVSSSAARRSSAITIASMTAMTSPGLASVATSPGTSPIDVRLHKSDDEDTNLPAPRVTVAPDTREVTVDERNGADYMCILYKSVAHLDDPQLHGSDLIKPMCKAGRCKGHTHQHQAEKMDDSSPFILPAPAPGRRVKVAVVGCSAAGTAMTRVGRAELAAAAAAPGGASAASSSIAIWPIEIRGEEPERDAPRPRSPASVKTLLGPTGSGGQPCWTPAAPDAFTASAKGEFFVLPKIVVPAGRAVLLRFSGGHHKLYARDSMKAESFTVWVSKTGENGYTMKPGEAGYRQEDYISVEHSDSESKWVVTLKAPPALGPQLSRPDQAGQSTTFAVWFRSRLSKTSAGKPSWKVWFGNEAEGQLRCKGATPKEGGEGRPLFDSAR